MHQPTEDENPSLCHYIFPATAGKPAHRCGSPALRGQHFCYYHHPTRRRVANPNERAARRVARQAFDITLPHSRPELNATLSEIIVRIAANRIDLRRAGLLLLALQTAARNLPNPPLPTRRQLASGMGKSLHE